MQAKVTLRPSTRPLAIRSNMFVVSSVGPGRERPLAAQGIHRGARKRKCRVASELIAGRYAGYFLLTAEVIDAITSEAIARRYRLHRHSIVPIASLVRHRGRAC